MVHGWKVVAHVYTARESSLPQPTLLSNGLFRLLAAARVTPPRDPPGFGGKIRQLRAAAHKIAKTSL